MSTESLDKFVGTIKVYYPLKGYGFITREKGKDVFFHFSEIKTNGGDGALMEGDKVSFCIEVNEKKTRAISVKKIG